MRPIHLLNSKLLLNFEAANKAIPDLIVNRNSPIYTDSNGKIIRHENNQPALLNNGLVLERGTTNFLITALSGGSTEDRTGTITSTTELAPDGTNTAARFACSTTNRSQGRYWASRVNEIGKKYCFSAYIKPFGNVRYVSMAFDSVYYTVDYFNFDLQTGECRAFGSSSLSGFVEKLENGWMRIVGEFIYKVAVPAAGGHTSIEVASSITGPRRPTMASSASNGYLIWMPQIELGKIPSSPIVSVAGSVATRPAQVMTHDLTSEIDASNFTLFGKIVSKEPGQSRNIIQDLFDFSDGVSLSTSEGCRCSYVVMTNGKHALVSNGSSNVFAQTDAVEDQDVSFICTAKDGVVKATFDGVNFFTSPNLSTGKFRKLNLGTNRSNGGGSRGLIKKLMLYSNGITQEEMVRVWPFIGERE